MLIKYEHHTNQIQLPIIQQNIYNHSDISIEWNIWATKAESITFSLKRRVGWWLAIRSAARPSSSGSSSGVDVLNVDCGHCGWIGDVSSLAPRHKRSQTACSRRFVVELINNDEHFFLCCYCFSSSVNESV